MTKNMELLASYIQDLECDAVTQICKDFGIIENDKIEKSCISCKNCDMCAFRLKVHYEFSPILRSGINSNTLQKIYKNLADDCQCFICSA